MIRLQDVSKQFTGTEALSRVTFEVPAGSICGLIGSNGAGKSTLMRLVAGVYKADAGTVTVDGQSTEGSGAREALVFVPDTLYFPGGATLWRMARLYGAAYSKFDRARFEELAALFHLNTKKSLSGFSKGMRREAALTLALACHPRVLLLDETFDGLDPLARGAVRRLLCDAVAEGETAILISSHSLRELEDLCDRVVMLHQGVLVAEGDKETLCGSLCKVQAAFPEEVDSARLSAAGVAIQSFERQGSVVQLIAEGQRDKVTEALLPLCPLFLEVLPLTLEETFAIRMRTLGYSFDEKEETL